MIEVLVVELRRPLQCLALAEGRTQREGAARVVLVAGLVEGGGRGIPLTRVLLELLTGEGAGELLLALHVVEVEAKRVAPPPRR